MKKEIKQINKELGLVRITTLDERWYAKVSKDEKTGLPIYEYFPSSTWIASYYYTSPYLIKWIADKGLTEAEAIKQAAGDKGSKVHYACGDIDEGKEIKIDATYLNHTTNQQEELTQEEIDCIMSYTKFVDEYKPYLLANELTAFGQIEGHTAYGGTLDKIFATPMKQMPDGSKFREIWILDIKTSSSVRKSHELQISSYSHMDIDYKALGITDEEWENRKLFVLQVGYKRNKNGYKLTEIQDKFELFCDIAYKTFKEENSDIKPQQKDYPLVLKSEFRTKKVEEKIKKIKK